jgi:hypothetical protein
MSNCDLSLRGHTWSMIIAITYADCTLKIRKCCTSSRSSERCCSAGRQAGVVPSTFTIKRVCKISVRLGNCASSVWFHLLRVCAVPCRQYLNSSQLGIKSRWDFHLSLSLLKRRAGHANARARANASDLRTMYIISWVLAIKKRSLRWIQAHVLWFLRLSLETYGLRSSASTACKLDACETPFKRIN